jgi:hypothetical protein
LLRTTAILTLLTSATVFGAETSSPAKPRLAKPQVAQSIMTPVPSDPFLRLNVAFIGTYRALSDNEERKLTLRSELTEVMTSKNPAGEEEARKDTFSYVQLPDNKGWGLFYPADERFRIVVTVEDDRNRLGVVLIRAQREGKLAEVVGRMKASRQGREVRGSALVDPAVPTYVVTIFSKQSAPLARIQTQVPRSLKMEFIDVKYGFQPYHPKPDPPCPACAGKEVPPSEQGNPKSLENRTLLPTMAQAHACLTKFFENATAQPTNVQPPLSLSVVESLRDTTTAWRERMEERLWGEYPPEVFLPYSVQYEWLMRMTQEHMASLSPIYVAPRTQGCAHWEVEMTGEVVTILAVPTERVRTIPDWYTKLRRVIQESTATQPLTSASLALLLNERFGKDVMPEGRQLQGGDVLAIGDVWLLRARSLKAEVLPKPSS